MPNQGYILGISAYYHDSAVALIKNGDIVAAAHEERFTRKKHDAGFPSQSIQFCLKHAGISLSDLDAIAFYDKPLLKFERLLETYYGFAPRGLFSFVQSIPLWIKEKLLLKKRIRTELKRIADFDPKKIKLFFPDHHLSHAASTFFASPFTDAAILTIDGVGEWATASLAEGRGNQIKVLRELHFPHSLGLLYSALTYYLGFKVNSGEYKLMGLAPYGNSTSTDFLAFKNKIKENICDLKPDGSIWLNQDYFNYATGLRMTRDSKWEQLLGIPRREPESEITQLHCDLALAIQHITEEVIIGMAREIKKLTGSDNLVLAGGVALNCVANTKLKESHIFNPIFIQPAAGDAGGALGAAWAVHYIYNKTPRVPQIPDAMQGSYLGPEFSEMEILSMAQNHNAVWEHFKDFESLSNECATALNEGKTIGWMQGRMEWGPRALGNRSILADPRKPEMQKKLNLQVKFRESFRPFAPVVLEEEAAEWFDLDSPSPYMLFVAELNQRHRKSLPKDFAEWPLKEKLYFERSTLPAITHLDYSARIQTVSAATNPKLHQLISAFKKQTGVPVLINTSFNVRGEPIVCTPEDAYRCFMRTELDLLVIGNFLFRKEKQPKPTSQQNPVAEFGLD